MKKTTKKRKSLSGIVFLSVCTAVLVCLLVCAAIAVKYHEDYDDKNTEENMASTSENTHSSYSLGKSMLEGISGWINKRRAGVSTQYDEQYDDCYDQDGNYIFDYNDAYAWVFPGMSLDAKKNTVFPADQIQEFMREYVNEEDSQSVELPGRDFDNSVTPYDGEERSITCWGDSMTEGFGTNEAYVSMGDTDIDISYFTFPSTLEMLSGITTYNLGVGGETSKQIAERQGGLPLYIDRDISVPENGAVAFNLLSEDGQIEYFNDYSGYGDVNNLLVNKVCINGNYFKMTFNGESHMLYKKIKQRTSNDLSANKEMSLQHKTYEIAKGSRVYPKAAIDRKDDILIIEMGSNGGWNDDLATLVSQYDAMLESTGCKFYIIIGDTDDPTYDAGIGETPWEATLHEAFGEHFINMRLYLIEHGLQDAGLNTTFADMEGYCNGEISKQLRADWTHLNAYGYYSKGIAIYNKGIELGYWN